LWFTYSPQPPDAPMAKPLIERLRLIDAELRMTFRYRAYAAVQVWAEVAQRAGGSIPGRVAATMREGSFDTVLARLGFDAKGDVTGVKTFTWYRWTQGSPVLIDTPKQ
jgi:branched-chain amino acid transport system substrate-binding protein